MDNIYGEIKVLMDNLVDGTRGKNFEGFSEKEMNDALRDKLIKVFGKTNPTLNDLRKPGAYEAFEIVSETIGRQVQANMEDEMQIADFSQVAWGDQKVFKVGNPDLFNVSVVAKGDGDVERQRLVNGKVEVETEALAVKIYSTFMEFMSGKVDWVDLTMKVADSFTYDIKKQVWNALYNTPAVGGSSVYNVSSTGFDAGTIDGAIAHVKADNNNADVMIVGTTQALKLLVGSNVSDEMINDVYNTGVYQFYNGNALLPLGQFHKTGTDEFELTDDQVIIMPMPSEKPVKVVQEGEYIIGNPPMYKEGAMEKEYFYYGHIGVAVAAAKKYAIYTIN